MDKNKIKNIALGVSLGLNLLLGFFLGGGLISSCAAKKPVDASTSASVDASGEFIDPPQKRALAPRYAASDEIDPDEYPNLWVTSGSSYSVHYQCVIYSSNDPTLIAIGFSDQGICEFNKITTPGLYYVEVDRSFSWGGGFWINQTTYNTILTWGSTSTTYASFYADEIGYFYATQTMVNDGLYLAVSQANRNGVLPKVYLIDGDVLPASDRVVFPRNFFPWQIWGNRATDVLIGGPAVSSGSVAESQSLTFSDLLFRCNGRVYKGIMLVFSFRPGQHLGKYDPTGEIYANGVITYSSSNPAWFLSGMLYIPADPGVDSDRVLTANYAQLGENTLLMPNPVWSKDAYRIIDILDSSGASMTGVPSGVGSNTPMEWLNIIASAESIAATTSVADPFLMLGNGFSAVANILSIPILPFMTLGTLIAVPLIVLVILAILRLLAK